VTKSERAFLQRTRISGALLGGQQLINNDFLPKEQAGWTELLSAGQSHGQAARGGAGGS